jgi:hypothetical protein
VIRAEATNVRKKWLKRFKSEFLGIHQGRFDVTIENPEVILFKMQDKWLTASADQPIEITNKHLNYRTLFWLESYQSHDNEGMSWKGKYFMEDLALVSPKKQEAIENDRLEVFEHSKEYFFQSLADSVSVPFVLRTVQFSQNWEILERERVDPYSFLSTDSLRDQFHLQASTYFEVEHLNVFMRNQSDNNVHARSYIGSTSGWIHFDRQGNILNPHDLIEFGYWGQLGLADALPIGFEATSEKTGSEGIGNSKLAIFDQLLNGDDSAQRASLKLIQKDWSPSYIPILIELVLFAREEWVIEELTRLLKSKTRKDYGQNFYEWMQWLWKKAPRYDHDYADFKGYLYSSIDPKFRTYFEDRYTQSDIRFDEIMWGGVVQDGIPPLRNPHMIPQHEASYLADNDIVFGIVVNGDARAYPKRILGWHEFFTDRIGGVHIAGVYCTLCGTVIAYNSEVDGEVHKLGTSGFLYRSNKLMYDEATQSLWNTIEGIPVVGPLVGKGIQLNPIPVVTTTWSEWKNNHPETKVLSIKTGYNRDYSEGAAYKEYYSDDQLMFPVPTIDRRLKNKDEVFVLRTDNFESDPLAISSEYLSKNRLYHTSVGDKDIVILTSPEGASMAYASRGMRFTDVKANKVKDTNGEWWTFDHSGIHGPNEDLLIRLPAHRVFWFAWVNMYPDTRLVK